ncbi:MAG: molybdenum cofactor biosynthesis protein MoaE [Clostridia bacterium]|nr:molybdenum cofactor biosynthesis protein MoaE [Clostridia bacterium]
MAIDLNKWLEEAKMAPDADKCGMYLMHNGVVRGTAKAQVREGIDSDPVTGMIFSYDATMIDKVVSRAKEMPGIYYVRAELGSGKLDVGDDIMYILIGADTRPHALDAFNNLMDDIKGNCVKELEMN